VRHLIPALRWADHWIERAVLRELGMKAQEIKALRAKKVVA
jgi:hypothetical protein